MAGRNIGHVEFIVDFDGDRLPRQAREIGNRAGREMGEGIDKGADDSMTKFGDRLRRQMREHGRDSGLTFTDAFEQSINRNLDDTVREVTDVFSRERGFDDFAKTFDSIGDASDDLDRKLGRLHENGRITDEQFLELSGTLRRYQSEANRGARETERQREAFHDLSNELRGIEVDRLERVGNLMGDLERDSRRLEIARGEVEEFNRVFADDDAEANIRRYSRMFGDDLPRTFDHFENRMRSVREEFPHLGDDIDRVRDRAAGFRNEMVDTDNKFVRFLKNIDRFTDRHGNRAASLFARMGNSVRGLGGSLPQLSHNMRQAVFYTGLFTALAPGIAVLGSVAGSGIVALSASVAALGIGVAALIPGFKGMLDDVDKLPPKAQGAARALQAFGDPLKEMQDVIQEGMFDGLEDDIDRLRERTLPRITSGMKKTAVTLNGVFQDMIGRLTSKRALGRLDNIFEQLQPVLRDTSGAILNLGGAISTVFEKGLGSGRGFANFLETSTRDFNTWVNSDPGQAALSKWFDHLDEIMPRVGNLIASASKSISNLVTDQAVDNMARFLDVMTVAVPEVVGGLGDLVDSLDPLGLAADGVAKIGGWFADNTPGIKAFGGAAQDFVRNVGGQLGTLLGNIGEAILGIAPDVLDNVGAGLTAVGNAINSPQGKAALADLADVVGEAGEAVGDLLTQMADSGAIVEALEGIGKAAEVASKGIELFNEGNKAMNGDLDIPGGKEGGKAVDNYLKGGKEAWNQGWDDFWSLDPKKGERLLRAWGFNGGLKASDGFKEGLNNGIGGGLPTAGEKFDQLFGGANDAASKAGSKAKQSYVDGFTDTVYDLTLTIGEIFGGGKSEAGAAGEEAGGAYEEGLSLGLPDDVNFDGIFGGDAGKGAAGEAGSAAQQAYVTGFSSTVGDLTTALGQIFGGASTQPATDAGLSSAGAYTGGVQSGVYQGGEGIHAAGTYAAGQLAQPFDETPDRVGTAVGGIPGVIGGIMGLVTGQPGADNAANPFSAVPGRAGTLMGGLPGVIGGIMGIITGKPGADNTVNPFSAVPGGIGRNVAGAPGVVRGYMSSITGQPGADGVVRPFDGVPGRVGSKVSGTSGAVSRQLGGIDDFGAAGRIIGAFSGVPGAVGRALGGLGSVVSSALSAAGSALSIGISALKAKGHASGTITNGPEFALIGEAGPEAVVPLNRPLSRVDPAVRDLSAIAQGKAVAGSGGATYGTYVADGAVRIAAPNANPRAVAAATIDRLVAEAVG